MIFSHLAELPEQSKKYGFLEIFHNYNAILLNFYVINDKSSGRKLKNISEDIYKNILFIVKNI